MLALDNRNRRKSFLLWLLKHKRTDHTTETLAVAAFIRRSGLRTRRVLFQPNFKPSLREKINCVSLFFFKLLGGHQIQIAKGFQPGVKEGKQGWNHRAFTPSLKKWDSIAWYPSQLSFQTNKPPQSWALHKRAGLSLQTRILKWHSSTPPSTSLRPSDFLCCLNSHSYWPNCSLLAMWTQRCLTEVTGEPGPTGMHKPRKNWPLTQGS